jgi:hypothetical protein
MTLRPKEKCEICGIIKKSILHRHHIIPRIDSRSTDSDDNLAIVCPTCHSRVHTGEFIIIGLYQTTDGIKLMWFQNGEDPPLKEEFWKVKYNPLVITLNDKDIKK